jgi:hypothetical protein
MTESSCKKNKKEGRTSGVGRGGSRKAYQQARAGGIEGEGGGGGRGGRRGEDH